MIPSQRHIIHSTLDEQVRLGTLNSPIIVGHNKFLEHVLILLVRMNVGHITFQPTLKF